MADLVGGKIYTPGSIWRDSGPSGITVSTGIRPKPAQCCFAGSTCKKVPSLFSGFANLSRGRMHACMHGYMSIPIILWIVRAKFRPPIPIDTAVFVFACPTCRNLRCLFLCYSITGWSTQEGRQKPPIYLSENVGT